MDGRRTSSGVRCRCYESWVTMGTKERVGFHQPPLNTQTDLNTHIQLQPVLNLDALTLSWISAHKRLWPYIKEFKMKCVCKSLWVFASSQSPQVLLLECKCQCLWFIPPSLVQNSCRLTIQNSMMLLSVVIQRECFISPPPLVSFTFLLSPPLFCIFDRVWRNLSGTFHLWCRDELTVYL